MSDSLFVFGIDMPAILARELYCDKLLLDTGCSTGANNTVEVYLLGKDSAKNIEAMLETVTVNKIVIFLK